MITPAEFPYITSIHVNDCYTYQNFDIDLVKHQPFSHLILTGKNGSGKSTILKNLDLHITSLFHNNENIELNDSINKLKKEIKRLENSNPTSNQSQANDLKNILKTFGRLLITFSIQDNVYFNNRKRFIYSYLSPIRNSKVNNVLSPTKQDEFERQLTQNKTSSEYFIKNFKQFLVNRKVNQAFAQLRNNKEEIEKTNTFFEGIESIFGEIFEDKNLKLIFVEDSYEFFIQLNDGRQLTFDILPDGFSAFLSILMDLFTRLDLIRKSVGNFTYDPCGIVLIDEPETHLHLSLQYQVLPILTKLFPNVQFIVATHSPAVISSIKNVTVFDLTSKEVMSDEAVGKSFSELMVSHFGLDNEFSNVADGIFDKFNAIIKEYRGNIPQRNAKLKELLNENEKYISPTMRFELEAKLSE
ncbi:hypothetical protein GCM10011514_39520 [Emticicia aquatilis]|uniref:AAA+ ATPase domain-containing protein n=1 Tax=Emticicia aquatilis TaxID=1537369 RepID=A0A917DU86_9BACT|nr:AAA family ATPase [Emticicia aquatilis]GGD71505.1 hypothetical protein GCM10011514_39520 [Emticicia aquatilis]